MVATGQEPEPDRRRKVEKAFKAILVSRNLQQTEVDDWVEDCKGSLEAAIREDAVWVNRSAAFDAAATRIPSLTRKEAWDFLSPFFVNEASYLAPDKSAEDEESAGETKKAKDLVQKAGQWLSSRFGEGEGANFSALSKAYAKISKAAEALRGGCSGAAVLASLAKALTGEEPEDALAAVLHTVRATGHKSATRNQLKKIAGMKVVDAATLFKLSELAKKDAETALGKTGNKGHRPYADAVLKDVQQACGFTYLQQDGHARHWEFAVLLDHAARRVSVAHSWQKLAEARRQKFAVEAARKAPPDVEQWLDAFLEERGRLTGAAGPVQIRRRAVDGWADVVKAWSAASCKTADDRIAKARELQDELEKFGDIALFEALAADDAKVVWLRDGRPDPQPLLDYVLAHDAEDRMRRFKVPAYRHPDPLLHPVFCDFGKSRWAISFAVHEAAQKVRGASDNVDKFSAAHAEAKGEDAKMKAHVRLLKAKKALEAARAEFRARLADRGLSLRTWDGKAVAVTQLLWQSKRLAADLILEQTPDGTRVSRADRISRAAAGTGGDAAVLVLNVFEENDWNGRLQAPRAQLDRLAARVQKHGWDAQARKMLAGLRWFVTFSARLLPQADAPWPKYARAHNLQEDPKYWPHADENKKREGHARLILCRLPGLRVLSVDLGHHYAAACAVWETLTEKEMKKVCEAAGRRPPEPDDLALHLLGMRDGKKVKSIYRRTGPDMWARLDRQFLIKLQGEDAPCRKSSEQEKDAVARFETELGRIRTGENQLPHAVVGLMSKAVRSARLGLRRHGDRARVAWNLTTDAKLLPGGRSEQLTPESRIELLQDVLVSWHGLFSNPNWQDAFASALWDEHIAPLLQDVALPEVPAEGAAAPTVKAFRRTLRDGRR